MHTIKRAKKKQRRSGLTFSLASCTPSTIFNSTFGRTSLGNSMFGKFSIWQTKSGKCSWKIETFKIRDSVLFMAYVRFQVPPLQSLIVWLRFSANERVLCKPPPCVVFMGPLSSTTSTIFSVPLFTAHLAFENSFCSTSTDRMMERTRNASELRTQTSLPSLVRRPKQWLPKHTTNICWRASFITPFVMWDY